MTKEEKVIWLEDVYLPFLYQYAEDETDFYIQQSIHSDIGYVAAIREYNIDVNANDINDFKTYMKVALDGEE